MGTINLWQLGNLVGLIRTITIRIHAMLGYLNQLTMVRIGLVRILLIIKLRISMESPMGAINLWQLEKMEGSLDPLTTVEHLGFM